MLPSRINLFLCLFVFFSMGFQHHTVFSEDLDIAGISDKVRETYQKMGSYSSKGEIVTEMDMSNVDTSKLPGMPQNGDVKDSPLMKSMFQDKKIIKHVFEIQLTRQGNYRIEWDQNLTETVKMHGVAWSKDGQYKLKVTSPMMQQPVMEQKDKTMALAAATGVSGGAAHTIPSLFYDLENDLLKSIQNTKKLDDETLDEKDCYVISGDLMGQTMILWIDKESFLIKQRKQIIGENPMIGNMSDEDIKAGLEAAGQEVTPETLENFKKQMKSMAALSSQLKGSIVEKHSDIQVNPELKAEDLEPGE